MKVFTAQVGQEIQVGYPRISPFGRGFSPFALFLFIFNTSSSFDDKFH